MTILLDSVQGQILSGPSTVNLIFQLPHTTYVQFFSPCDFLLFPNVQEALTYRSFWCQQKTKSAVFQYKMSMLKQMHKIYLMVDGNGINFV